MELVLGKASVGMAVWRLRWVRNVTHLEIAAVIIALTQLGLVIKRKHALGRVQPSKRPLFSWLCLPEGDVAETCDGVNVTCPPNKILSNNTICLRVRANPFFRRKYNISRITYTRSIAHFCYITQSRKGPSYSSY